jgi:hypothetical protein
MLERCIAAIESAESTAAHAASLPFATARPRAPFKITQGAGAASPRGLSKDVDAGLAPEARPRDIFRALSSLAEPGDKERLHVMKVEVDGLVCHCAELWAQLVEVQREVCMCVRLRLRLSLRLRLRLSLRLRLCVRVRLRA